MQSLCSFPPGVAQQNCLKLRIQATFRQVECPPYGGHFRAMVECPRVSRTPPSLKMMPESLRTYQRRFSKTQANHFSAPFSNRLPRCAFMRPTPASGHFLVDSIEWIQDRLSTLPFSPRAGVNTYNTCGFFDRPTPFPAPGKQVLSQRLWLLKRIAAQKPEYGRNRLDWWSCMAFFPFQNPPGIHPK